MLVFLDIIRGMKVVQNEEYFPKIFVLKELHVE